MALKITQSKIEFKPTDKILDKGWRSFAEITIPATAPEMQIMDMRQAFYSGAMILWSGMMQLLNTENKETEMDYTIMARIQKELNDYYAEIMKSDFIQRDGK